MHQTMRGTLHPVFNSRQLLLASTAKPVTPFGGLVSLIEFFNVLRLGEVLGRLMPFTYTSGKAGSARGVVPFLQEALALMPTDGRLRTVRADSGFFDQALLGFLEERALPYIIVARMTRTLKAAAASIRDWTSLDAHYSAASFPLQLHGWSKQRHFVVIRELELEDKSAVGRWLIEVPGYTYRIFVTKRDEEPVTLWRDYNQRACVEQRIEELKNDLAADGFCLQQLIRSPPHGTLTLRAALRAVCLAAAPAARLFATEAAFLSMLFAFNLLSLHQQATGTRSEKYYQRPATLRSAVFLGEAILGNRARQRVSISRKAGAAARSTSP